MSLKFVSVAETLSLCPAISLNTNTVCLQNGSRPTSNIAPVLAILVLIVSLSVQSLWAGDHLQVSGRFLKSPCGDTILLRGFNKMCVYESDRWGMTMMPDMKKTGANVLRIVWTTSDKAWMVDTLDAVIQSCIDNHMIPMVELHDATGDFKQLPGVVSYWMSAPMLALIKKHEKYLICNIANEAGDFDVNDADYKSAYSAIVQQFRSNGVHCPLVIDADGYGQNVDVILNTAPAIIAADPDKNLMFSLHAYWAPKYFPNPATLFHDKVVQIVAQNIPFMVGEFTGCYIDDPVSTDDLWKTILVEAQTNRFGWMAWEWGPGNADYSTDPPTAYPKMDMTEDGSFAKIKDGWARSVLLDDQNSIAKTAITCDYIKNKGVCPSSDVALEYTSGTEAEICDKDVLVLHNELEARIEMYNTIGQCVSQHSVGSNARISLTNYESGSYVLRCTEAEKVWYKTILVLHP